jgi:hypothetical protein
MNIMTVTANITRAGAQKDADTTRSLAAAPCHTRLSTEYSITIYFVLAAQPPDLLPVISSPTHKPHTHV